MRLVFICCLAVFAVGCGSIPKVGSSFPGLAGHGPKASQWVSAIPSNAVRATLVPTTIEAGTLAAITGQSPSPVMQVSTHSSTYVVEAIGEVPVRNLEEVLLCAADGSSEAIELEIRSDDTLSQHRLTIPKSELSAVQQAVGSAANLVRIMRAGRPAAVVRSGSARCVVSPRVDRTTGLVHIALQLSHCGEVNRVLPREIRVSMDGPPLNCLTVAETLELLYGDPDSVSKSVRTFSEVSEQNDYLLPTNFKRLASEFAARNKSLASRPVPKLVSMVDFEFPGDAILGDARALGMFAMQRARLAAGEETEGWLMFQASDRRAQRLTVEIDLGEELIPIDFSLPREG